MNYFEFKKILPTLTTLTFSFENGNKIPEHFHITEIGVESKKYIDCGGHFRFDEKVIFQLWVMVGDEDHRLTLEKLNKILAKGEEQLGVANFPIIIEYQGNTIERYALDFSENNFILTPTTTSCLAPDQCGSPTKKKVPLSSLADNCTPGSGCC